MATILRDPERPEEPSRLKRWLLQPEVAEPGQVQGPHRRPSEHHQQPWWKVMCLTGVDYFSTLGYQPGIAALAAGVLSPVATLVLVLLTLFGALPIYRRVAAESPNGEGSIAMLERLLSWWRGKLFVLALLGFVATDFVITITLSAADATAHVLENPYAPGFVEHQAVLITLVLMALLGAVFLKGFTEAIGIAVALVAVYLALNLVVVGGRPRARRGQPEVVTDWRNLLRTDYASPLAMVAVALVVFPKLALGLSGFETGVAVMPLVRGDPGDTPENPRGPHPRHPQAAHHRRPDHERVPRHQQLRHHPADPAGGLRGRRRGQRAGPGLSGPRATSGDVFGTVYDLSTIAILWFAGASAMAGLLNIVPRYLPRYGMAPEWARAVRPLVLVFTGVAFAVTVIFRRRRRGPGRRLRHRGARADDSASVAVTLSARRRGSAAGARLLRGDHRSVFAYTTVANMVERPDGREDRRRSSSPPSSSRSLVSRASRATELRVDGVQLDADRPAVRRRGGGRRASASSPTSPTSATSASTGRRSRRSAEANHIPDADTGAVPRGDGGGPVGVRARRSRSPARSGRLPDPAGRERRRRQHHRRRPARHPRPDRPASRTSTSAGPRATRSRTWCATWSSATATSPPVTREVLRKAERDPDRRPLVHIG